MWHVGEVVEERWKMSPTTISLNRPSCSVISKFHQPVKIDQCVAFFKFHFINVSCYKVFYKATYLELEININ